MKNTPTFSRCGRTILCIPSCSATSAKNTKQEHYHGLTYRYMEDYIASHGSAEDRRIYDEKKLISECHSKGFRYPVIKSWFLERFPEIKTFGVPVEAESSVEAPAEAPKLALAF